MTDSEISGCYIGHGISPSAATKIRQVFRNEGEFVESIRLANDRDLRVAIVSTERHTFSVLAQDIVYPDLLRVFALGEYKPPIAAPWTNSVYHLNLTP